MKHKRLSFNWDLLGISTSILCAIHCIALPLVATFSLIGSSELFHDELFELIMIIVAAGIAFISLGSSFLKNHRNPKPILIILLGFTAIGIGHHIFTHDLTHIFTAVGGICIAWAHFVNWRLLRRQSAYRSTSS